VSGPWRIAGVGNTFVPYTATTSGVLEPVTQVNAAEKLAVTAQFAFADPIV